MSGTGTRYELIIFDLDGVITTEHIYWECARLTLWELLHLRLGAAPQYVPAVHDPAARAAILPPALIFDVKNRAVNSNWDLTFLASCAILVSLENRIDRGQGTVDELLRASRAAIRRPVLCPEAVHDLLRAAGQRRGVDLLTFAGRWASEATGASPELFRPEGQWWQYIHDRFQLWYEGLLMGVWGAEPLPERPVLPVQAIHVALTRLRESGHTLGVATGRPREEALRPLQALGILDLFSRERVVTHTEVEQGQRTLGRTSLGKPHPYSIRRAMFPEVAPAQLMENHHPPDAVSALVVGDSASDALAARKAGVPCVGVLSGVAGEKARQARRKALLEAGCVAVLDDITRLPEWLQGDQTSSALEV